MISGRMKYALAAAIIVVVGVGSWWIASRRQRAAESAAWSRLRKLHAIVQWDASRRHVSTLMIREQLDQALAAVHDTPYLAHLDVANTSFGDQDVEHIRHLSRLKSLVLSNTKVTDACLDDLLDLPIESLFLAQTAITDRAISKLAELSSLKVLDLSHTRVQTNLRALSGAENLEWLVLTGIDLSDVGSEAVDVFVEMPQLRRLALTGTRIDEALVRRLKAARPNMIVEADGARESGAVGHSESSPDTIPAAAAGG